MRSIHDNLQAVRGRIARAAAAAGRDPRSVALLAVTKTHPVALLEQAVAAGQRAFGENHVQEAVEKMALLAGNIGEQRACTLEWHLLGPLQSNKTKLAAARFDWVHTVASEKIARRLSAQRPAGMATLNVLIQVNVSGEASKGGVAPGEIAGLAQAIASLPKLKLRGLMAIPEPTRDEQTQRCHFFGLRKLLEKMQTQHPALDTLSMGMSDDLEAAIAEGATLVRIGTAIFGDRRSKGTESSLAPVLQKTRPAV
ncbi:MAG: YggS family pyridoxal phosphate-dependent enzyme [Betaproteobacteria bacterium]|nr:YggS family pyridoxal phosphate-dependent enzyme [Betaproteobacteria bacterium]